MTSDAPKARGRWPRFRLSTVLLLVTIVALGVAQYVAMVRTAETQALNRRLAAENAKLRAEAGQLEIDDPSKVAALRISDLDELTWRWKVYLPKGNWFISYLTQGIPREGVTNGPTAGSIEGGREVLVSATVRKGADGRWVVRTALDGAKIGSTLKESHRLIAPLINPAPLSGESTDIAGDKVQESLDPKQPVVLLRLRAHDVVQTASGGWEHKDDPQSSDGIMVWLNRQP
ncbi:MAG: hypothetical protein WD845_16345 [Pirellulales bacterium]